MELYAQYVKETTGRECVYDDHSFYTYSLFDDMVYLEIAYIDKEYRGSGKAKEIVDSVYEIGRENNCKCLISSVCKNSFKEIQERSNYMLIKMEFKKYDENENMIYYYKEIK